MYAMTLSCRKLVRTVQIEDKVVCYSENLQQVLPDGKRIRIIPFQMSVQTAVSSTPIPYELPVSP